MKLSEILSEFMGWGAYFRVDKADPEVYVRVGNARAPLTCMEIGSDPGPYGADTLRITIGDWHHAEERDDVAVDDTGTVMVDPSLD